MASYLPPNETLPIFDTTVFDQETALDYKTALTQFLTYPVAQGDETLQAITVQGQADFENQVNFNFLNSPPHCSIPPTSANDLCNKAYVDSQAPLTAFQLFCNYSQTYTTPTPTTYKLLSDTEVFSPTVLPFTTSAIGTQYITGFFNSISTLNIGSTIPPGNWTFNCYANVSAIGDQSHIGLSYSIIGVSALGVETILYTSASSNLITVVSPSVGIYPMTITVPSTSLSAYTVIGVKLYITSNTGATRTGNIYFQETSYYTNLLTSFSVLAPANIVNSNNVWTGTNTFNNQLSMGASGSNTLTIGGTSANISSTSTTGNLTLSTPASSTGSIAFNTNGSSAMSINSSRIVNMTNPPVMSGASISNGTIPILSVVGTAMDISTSQTVGGTKTFSSPPAMSGASISSGTIPITSVVGTACDLTTSQTIGGTKTFSNAPTMSGTGISGGIPITSVVGTAMDLSTTQTVGGVKTFSSTITASNGMTGNASSASVLQGGTAYSLPYQNNLSTTTYLANGATGYLLSSTVSNPPSWKDPSTLTIGTATNATNVNVVDRSATAGAFNIGVVQSLSGNQAVGACSALTYNNTSGILYSPQSLVGPSSNNTVGQNNTYSKFTGVRNDITNNATAGSFKFFNADGSNVSTNTLTLSAALNSLTAVNNTAPTASPGNNTTTIATTAFVQNAIAGSSGNASTITLSNTASGATNYLVMSATNSGTSSLLTDNSGATYDSTTNTAVINVSGNAATATNATNVNVVDRSATAGAFNIGVVQSLSGNQAIGACSALTYNNTSGILYSPQSLVGPSSNNTAGQNNTFSKFTGVRNDITNNATAGSFKFFNTDGSNVSTNTLTLSSALNTLSAVNNTAPTASPGDNTTTIATTAFVTNAVSAGSGTATNVNVVNQTATAGSFNIGILQGVSGALPVGASTGLTYNNTSGTLTCNNFAGTATNATNVNTTSDNTSGTYYPTFVKTAGTGTMPLYKDDGVSAMSYNPLTSTLSLTNLTITGNTNLGTTSTFSSGQVGWSQTTNSNLTMVTGTVYSMAVNLPSNGVWFCSGSMNLSISSAATVTLLAAGFTLSSGAFNNPQSGPVSTTMFVQNNTVVYPANSNPLRNYINGAMCYTNTAGNTNIYYSCQANYTPVAAMMYIMSTTITRIA